MHSMTQLTITPVFVDFAVIKSHNSLRLIFINPD